MCCKSMNGPPQKDHYHMKEDSEKSYPDDMCKQSLLIVNEQTQSYHEKREEQCAALLVNRLIYVGGPKRQLVFGRLRPFCAKCGEHVFLPFLRR